MDIRDEFEERIKRIEDFIEEKGVGSSRLTKAKKLQRNINLGIFLGSLLTVTGVTVWLLNRDED